MKTCNTCKHSKFVLNANSNDYIAFCKRSYRIDPIDGLKHYTHCRYNNPNGNCNHHELNRWRKLWIKLKLIKEKIVKNLFIF